MAFSEMEMSAEHFIWDVLGLEVDDGKLLTCIDTNDKFVLAKKLSIRYQMPIHPNDQTAADAWSAISEAVEARNKMAHGVWRMIDGSTPIVISYRIPIETGQINSEEFSLERICEVESLCFKAKKLFDILSRRIAAEGRPKLPSSPDRPNDSELPSRK